MPGFNDTTLGYQNIGVIGHGMKAEFCFIDYSNDVSVATYIPTTLSTIYGWVGHVSVCADAGCVSAGFGKPITKVSMCTGSILCISTRDVTVATLTEEACMTYIVWGF